MSVRPEKFDVALRLLEQSRLANHETEAFFGRAISESYWRELNPQLAIAGELESEAFEAERLSDEGERKALEKFGVEGYFRLDSFLSSELIARMRQAVEVLRREGWPVAFAFVYDEFWLVWRTPGVARLVSGIMGRKGYREVLHHIWCHYIPVHGRSSGWPPHVDGYPDRLTLWIPLSDATLDNGCIYLIPKNLTPERIARGFHEIEAFSFDEVQTLLQQSRALPAPAGSVLCWGDQVIHWGAACVEPVEPRMSIALELAGRDLNDETQVSRNDDPYPPAFSKRLEAIGKAILRYRKFEPLMVRYTSLAERLVKS